MVYTRSKGELYRKAESGDEVVGWGLKLYTNFSKTVRTLLRDKEEAVVKNTDVLPT